MKKVNNRFVIGFIAVALLISCHVISSTNDLPTKSFTTDTVSPAIITRPVLTLTNTIETEITSPYLTSAEENYFHIKSISIKPRSLEEISYKYLRKSPDTISPAQVPLDYSLGDYTSFTIHNDDDEQYYQIEAVLLGKTEHAYFWVESGLHYSQSDVKSILEKFENHIYPKNTGYFGNESLPGIDGDPHIYILYAQNLGTFVAGYFSADNAAPRSLNEFSNEHEMIYINADGISLNDDSILAILAHEHQHMIQYNQDKTEETWISEGSAEFATYLNGYYNNWNVYSYLIQPDIPLIRWNEDMAFTAPFYAGGFLFATYFAERFGSQTMQAMTKSKEVGLFGVEDALGQSSNSDYSNLEFEVLFGDWAIANLINDPHLENGRYAYELFDLPSFISPTEEFNNCPLDTITRSVNQFGVDYYDINCPGSFVIEFAGNSTIPVISGEPHSGLFMMWSNLGNESSMTMTKQFDFSMLNADEIKLSFWTWYDIEEEYDYVYVLVSRDMNTWDLLEPAGCISGRYSFGCGLTGNSSGWVENELLLTEYSGDIVYIQFEYLTDLAVNGEGLLLDDIRIDAINYFEDFESGKGGWSEEGFVRISRELPQSYQIALVSDQINVNVDRFTYLPGSILSIPITDGNAGNITLVVAATTPFARFPADYSITIK